MCCAPLNLFVCLSEGPLPQPAGVATLHECKQVALLGRLRRRRLLLLDVLLVPARLGLVLAAQVTRGSGRRGGGGGRGGRGGQGEGQQAHASEGEEDQVTTTRDDAREKEERGSPFYNFGVVRPIRQTD